MLRLSRVKFDGFMTVYSYDTEKSTMNAAMKKITKDTEITLSELKPQQHFTQPPAHFTEASLVKTLEELGIVVQVRMHRQLLLFWHEDIL